MKIEIIDPKYKGCIYMALIEYADIDRAIAAGGISRKKAIEHLLEGLDKDLNPNADI